VSPAFISEQRTRGDDHCLHPHPHPRVLFENLRLLQASSHRVYVWVSPAPRVSVADTLTRVRNTLKRQGTQALINLRKYFYDVSRDEAGSLSEADLSKLFNAFDVSLSEAVRPG
jgi:hypothetical protein